MARQRYVAWTAAGALALAGTVAAAGSGWLGLVAGALSTPTSADDASSNVALDDGVAFVARSARGLDIVALDRGTHRAVPPLAPADRIDDVAVADGLLFALDATAPGHLLVYRIAPGGGLVHVTTTPVPVGPFSGVAAGGGHVVVSGGTSALTLRRYAADGTLSAPVEADYGRGQPDVALVPGGHVALVSTHVQGPRFGLTVVDIGDAPLALNARGYVEIPGAGFTAGGFHPANFPLQAAAFGTRVLVAHGGGLDVLDAPPGQAPVRIGSTPLALRATAIAVDAAARRAFVAGVGNGAQLLEIDLADARAPRILDRHRLPPAGSPSAIALDDRHLVVALQGGGVQFMARSAPSSLHPNATETPQ
jgi:hypothetical protein